VADALGHDVDAQSAIRLRSTRRQDADRATAWPRRDRCNAPESLDRGSGLPACAHEIEPYNIDLIRDSSQLTATWVIRRTVKLIRAVLAVGTLKA